MSERLDRLRRDIEAERALALAELGLSFDGPLLVRGDQMPEAIITARTSKLPEALRDEAQARMRAAVVWMPWLVGRDVRKFREI